MRALRWRDTTEILLQGTGYVVGRAFVATSARYVRPDDRPGVGLWWGGGVPDRRNAYFLVSSPYGYDASQPDTSLRSSQDCHLAMLAGAQPRAGVVDTHLATGLVAVPRSDDAVGVYRMLTGELLQELPAPGKLHGLCFTDDGDLVLVRERDGVLSVAVAERA